MLFGSRHTYQDQGRSGHHSCSTSLPPLCLSLSLSLCSQPCPVHYLLFQCQPNKGRIQTLTAPPCPTPTPQLQPRRLFSSQSSGMSRSRCYAVFRKARLDSQPFLFPLDQESCSNGEGPSLGWPLWGHGGEIARCNYITEKGTDNGMKWNCIEVTSKWYCTGGRGKRIGGFSITVMLWGWGRG